MYPIPFNRAAVTGRETEYVTRAITQGPIHGDGPFTRECHEWLERLIMVMCATGFVRRISANIG